MENDKTYDIVPLRPMIAMAQDEPSRTEAIAPEVVVEQSLFQRARDYASRKKMSLAVGAMGLSAAATITNNPLSELKDDVITSAPWVGAGVLASEALFVAGAGMMAASVKDKIGNPFKIKERIPQIAQKAAKSKLFWTGFWVNTVGATGDFVAISSGVIAKMPPESYPMLALPLLDLGVTVAVRKAIINSTRENSVDTP